MNIYKLPGSQSALIRFDYIMKRSGRFDLIANRDIIMVSDSQSPIGNGFDVLVSMLEQQPVSTDSEVVLDGATLTGDMYS